MRAVTRLGLILVGLAFAGGAAAQFSAQITPPRFEDRARAGEVYREVIEISNVAPTAARMGVSTADWTLSADGSVAFEKSLAKGSCRPWTALEATEVQVPGNGKKRFRFEVRVPADAPRQQCRFAILFEGDPTPVKGMVVPVSGRIAIIVYLDIGDAQAKLRVVGQGVVESEGRLLPMLRVENTGDAHGRLQGFLDGIDPSGERWTLAPTPDPILPGMTREILVYPLVNDGEPVELSFPMQVRGQLEWRGTRVDVDATVTR